MCSIQIRMLYCNSEAVSNVVDKFAKFMLCVITWGPIYKTS